MANDEIISKTKDADLWDVATDIQNEHQLDNYAFNAVIEALRAAYTQGRADAEGKGIELAYALGRADAWRWIPVSERLPEKESFEEVEFLTRDEVSGTSEVVRYECGERIDGEFIICVSHWLPITLPGGEND